MAENKILVFGENVASEDYLTDAEYSTNEIRSSGNIVGLARRKPNNKALKQGTLMASALAQVLADSDGEWAGTEINDSLTPAGIKGIFKNYLETKIDSFTKAISLFSNERYEYDEDTDYLPADARTYNGELYICKQANGPSSTVVNPDSITPSGKDYWMKVGEGGTSYEIGQRVESLIPLTNAMLHPTDGALISGSGSYAEFVTIMAQKVSTNPELFVTEAAWQQTVTGYGECGKFVYDNVANTIRLPLLNGYVKATNTAGEVGDLVEAVAPNIKGDFGWEGYSLYKTASGAFSGASSTTLNFKQETGSSAFSVMKLDASRSSSVYKDSATTIDVQAIKVYSYIVLGTVTKTSIQIDIDQVMSDLALKADKDLSNVTAPVQAFKDMSIAWGMPDYSSGIDIGSNFATLGGSWTAPSDGFIEAIANTPISTYIFLYTQPNSNISSNDNVFLKLSFSGSDSNSLSVIVPILKGQTVYQTSQSPFYFRTAQGKITFYPCKGAN